MAKKSGEHTKIQLRHRGRFPQLRIYFGKLARIFVYQNDWKVLPMAAVIAAMVSLVIRNKFNVTMEGTLMGSLALSCVAIWNGCFNSIQVICRERSIIKREHRSGMHVSAYVGAHMLFQVLICAMQTGITLYVCSLTGMRLGGLGLFTPYMVVDLGITVFLITYAADMLSLFISGIVHSTMAAMTIMPFVLIFQLVFSGGIFALPQGMRFMSDFTISHYGLQCIAAQAHYNELPLASGWDTLNKMRSSEIDENITIDQAIEFLLTNESDAVKQVVSEELSEGITLEDALIAYQASPDYEKFKDKSVHVQFTIGDVIDIIGKDKLKETGMERGRVAGQKEEYALNVDNVMNCWIQLIFFAFLFAGLTVISLEFIDKDKR